MGPKSLEKCQKKSEESLFQTVRFCVRRDTVFFSTVHKFVSLEKDKH